MTKLKSKRIEALVAIASEYYDEVWDLCCDHGMIGLHFANVNSPKIVHFIDQVKSITDKLKKNLPTSKTRFNVACMPCENIQINESSKNLIILAGVGSETITKALNNLKTQNLGNTQILVSTHKHPHKLRRYLRDKKFSLIKEKLIFEGGHFYEILLIDVKLNNEISLVGKEMWNFHDLDHLKYCNQLIDYYEIKLKHGKIEVQDLFNELNKIKRFYKDLTN